MNSTRNEQELREIDTLIGEHFFGLDRTKQYEIPHYTSDMNEAMKLVQKLRKEKDYWFELSTPESFSLQTKCFFQLGDMEASAVCDNPEEAICRAALKTIGIEK